MNLLNDPLLGRRLRVYHRWFCVHGRRSSRQRGWWYSDSDEIVFLFVCCFCSQSQTCIVTSSNFFTRVNVVSQTFCLSGRVLIYRAPKSACVLRSQIANVGTPIPPRRVRASPAQPKLPESCHSVRFRCPSWVFSFRACACVDRLLAIVFTFQPIVQSWCFFRCHNSIVGLGRRVS